VRSNGSQSLAGSIMERSISWRFYYKWEIIIYDGGRYKWGILKGLVSHGRAWTSICFFIDDDDFYYLLTWRNLVLI
jgi:hypothetical protein